MILENPPDNAASADDASKQASATKPKSSKWTDPSDQAPPSPFEAASIFGGTPLTAGENRTVYSALLAEIEQAIAPKDFFERLTVADLGHALWEEQRYRDQQVALTQANRLRALACLLLPICQQLNLSASKIISSYFGPDQEACKEVTGLLSRYGITDSAISAQAAELHGQSMASFDRLVAARQNLRFTVLREHERRRRKARREGQPYRRRAGCAGRRCSEAERPVQMQRRGVVGAVATVPRRSGGSAPRITR